MGLDSRSFYQDGRQFHVGLIIGASFRIATIPFDTDSTTVTNFVPQLYYEDDLFFLRGLEAGDKTFHAGKKKDLRL